MITATQIRNGMVLQLDNSLYRVMNVNHITPGNKRGIIQTQLRNLTSGNQEDRRFGSDEKVERVVLSQHEMEYLYADGEQYHFMNTETYEQVSLNKDDLGGMISYLLPNTKVTVEFFESNPIGVVLPQTVILAIVEAEPNVKRGTASGSYKQATVETGLAVRVPPFVEVGDRIKVDTTTGNYVERV